MSTMIMNPPHRKPLPQRYDAAPAAAPYNSIPPQSTMRQAPPAQYVNGQDAGFTRVPGQYQAYHGTMTSQTNITPAYSMTSQSQLPSNNINNAYPGTSTAASRRTLSNATSSTSSSQHAPTASTTSASIQRVSTNSSYGAAPGVRRSTSSRSNSSVSPTSYVALMRKQKATVWCDRAQHEDPRILAAQRQAKMRAAAEVAGGHNYLSQTRIASSGQGMVGGVRSKIRHHGAPKASAYTGLGGAGVPIRMSASEVDDAGGSDADEASITASNNNNSRFHTRTGSSGRSSIGSGSRRLHSFQNSSYGPTGATPPGNSSPVESMGDLQEEETPMPRASHGPGDDYFMQHGGSGNSAERRGEESFGSVGGLPQKTKEQTGEKKYSADELRRRGSVDDRTMTMSGVRLFVANPDLSD